MSSIEQIRELLTEIENELGDAEKPNLDRWIALAGIQASLAQTEALIGQQETVREAMVLQREALAQVAATAPRGAPEPPDGWGAVVEDDTGAYWTRVAREADQWVNYREGVRTWGQITPVRVVSEGVR